MILTNWKLSSLQKPPPSAGNMSKFRSNMQVSKHYREIIKFRFLTYMQREVGKF